MSGLYNMIMERRETVPYLMAALGFVQDGDRNHWLGRFRDAYTNPAGDRIFILHRNYPESEQCNQLMKGHENYISYTPDAQDYTYCVWEFSVPEEAKELIKMIASVDNTTPCMDRYRKIINDMENKVDSPEVQRAIEAGKKIMAPLVEAVNNPGKPVNRTVGSVQVFNNLNPPEAN